MELVNVMISMVIGSIVMIGTTENMRSFLRAQHSSTVDTERHEIFRRIAAAAESEAAMKLTLTASHNSAFRACVENPGSCHSGQSGTLVLLNDAKKVVSPARYGRKFEPCASSDCPFTVSTTWNLECASNGCAGGYTASVKASFTSAPKLALLGYDETGGTIEKTLPVTAKSTYPARYTPACSNWATYSQTTSPNAVLAQGTAAKASMLSLTLAVLGSNTGGRARLNVLVNGSEITKVVAQDSAPVAMMGGHQWENDYGSGSVTVGPGHQWQIIFESANGEPSGFAMKYCLTRID